MSTPDYLLTPVGTDSTFFSPARVAEEIVTKQAGEIDWNVQYFDRDGLAAPVAPRMTGGVLTAAGLRTQRGAGYVGDRWYLATGTQWLSALTDRTYGFIGEVSGGNVLTADGPVPLSEATAKQVWDTVDPNTKRIYEQMGLDEDRILRQTNNDPYKLNKLHQEVVERSRVDAMLEGYAADHGFAYTVAGGLAFLGDVITDPANIFSLGTAGVVSVSGKAAARVATSRVGRTLGRLGGKSSVVRELSNNLSTKFSRMAQRFNEGRIIEGLVEAGVPIQDAWARRVLVGTTTLSNMGQDLALQYAEHETNIRFGLVEEDDDFRVSLGRLGASGLFAFALSSLVSRAMGRPIHHNVSEYMLHNKNTAVSEHLQSMINSGRITPDDALDPQLVGDMEKAYNVLRATRSGGDYDSNVALIQNSMLGKTPKGMELLTNYIARVPSKAELEEFINTKFFGMAMEEAGDLDQFMRMLDGDMDELFSKLPDTAWSQAKKAEVEARAEYLDALNPVKKVFVRPFTQADFSDKSIVEIKPKKGDAYEGKIISAKAKRQKIKGGGTYLQWSLEVQKLDGTTVKATGGTVRQVTLEDGTVIQRGKQGSERELTQVERVAEANKKLVKAQEAVDKAKQSLQLGDVEEVTDPKIKEWLSTDFQTSRVVHLREDKGKMAKRAARVVAEHVNSSDTLGYRATGLLLDGFRKLTWFMNTEDANKIVSNIKKKKELTGFRKLYLTLTSMIDDNGLSAYVVRPDGTAVETAYMRSKKIQGVRARLMQEIEKHLGETTQSNLAEHEAVGVDVMSALANNTPFPTPEAAAIGAAMRNYMDNMGIRATRAGVLPNLIENFLPVKIKDRVMLGKNLDKLSDILVDGSHGGAWRGWIKQYEPNNDGDAPLYRAALFKARIIADPEGNNLADGLKGTYDRVPTRLNELTPDDQDSYMAALRPELKKAAHEALAKRAQGVNIDDIPDADLTTNLYEDAAALRKIEQEFWYSDAVLKNKDFKGLLDTNLNHLTYDYERGIGYQIALQETLAETFGEPVRWQDAVRVLQEMAAGDADAEKLVANLKKLEQIAANRVSPTNRSDILDFLSSFARTVTFSSVPVTIAATEGSVALARAIGTGNIRSMTRAMKILFQTIDRDMLRRFGFAADLEYDDSRIYGMVDAIDSQKNSRATVTMRKIEDATRKFGTEMLMTRRLKSMHFYMSSGLLDNHRTDLSRLSVLNQRFDRSTKEGNRAFLAAARQAGVRPDKAQMMVEAGITSPKRLAAAQEFLKLDPDILAKVPEMERRLYELPTQFQADARELIDGLTNIGVKDAESFVTSVSPNSIRRSDDALANAAFMFISFPTAFVQRTLTRAMAAQGISNWKGFTYLGIYLFGELMSNAFRRVLYNGDKWEDIIQELEEDPLLKAGEAFIRAPLFGPWNIVPATAISMFTGARSYDPMGSAALSRGINAVKSAFKLGQQIADPDADIESESLNRVLNVIPGANMWWLRMPFMLRHFSGFADPVDLLLDQYDPQPTPEINLPVVDVDNSVPFGIQNAPSNFSFVPTFNLGSLPEPTLDIDPDLSNFGQAAPMQTSSNLPSLNQIMQDSRSPLQQTQSGVSDILDYDIDLDDTDIF